MTMRVNDTVISDLAKELIEKGFDGLGNAVAVLINESMKIERERHLNASHYERNELRADHANGFKAKQLKTRIGTLDLKIPQVRNCDFYPSFLEKGLRSERALTLALSEMYIQGVSTRKVNKILEEMCGFEVTSMDVSRATKALDDEFIHWRTRQLKKYVYLILDARYEKVRQGGSVVDSAVLVAYGIDTEGRRDVLGVSVSLSEAEIHWRKFLESLVSRGLYGLECITSDAHSGLKAALRAVFPSVKWQRCQFHLQQNAQSYVPKQSMRKEVAEEIRVIFNSPNREEATRYLNLVIVKYNKTAPKLSEWLESNLTEGFTIFDFKMEHRVRLRTSNMAERVNRRINTRTNVASIFPSAESCERLVTAVLIEISEEWRTEKNKYLPM